VFEVVEVLREEDIYDDNFCISVAIIHFFNECLIFN
jgi:hypothetical protein